MVEKCKNPNDPFIANSEIECDYIKETYFNKNIQRFYKLKCGKCEGLTLSKHLQKNLFGETVES
jgi:hypothetical protein